MNGKEIIKEYLEKNGFDGLFSDDGECGCENSDLMPCESDGCMKCEPGYKHQCCCGDGHSFHIKSDKPSTMPETLQLRIFGYYDPCSPLPGSWKAEVYHLAESHNLTEEEIEFIAETAKRMTGAIQDKIVTPRIGLP